MDEMGLQAFYNQLVQQDNVWVDTDKNAGLRLKLHPHSFPIPVLFCWNTFQLANPSFIPTS